MFPPAGCFLRRAPTFQSFLGTAVAESGPPAPRAGAIAIKRLTQGHVFYIRRRVHAVQHSGGSCWSNWSEYNAGYLAREELSEGNGCSLGAWGRNCSSAKLWGLAEGRDADARCLLRLSHRPSRAQDGGKGAGKVPWVWARGTNLPRRSRPSLPTDAPAPGGLQQPPAHPSITLPARPPSPPPLPGAGELTAEEN